MSTIIKDADSKTAIWASESKLEKNNLQFCFCCWHYTKSHQPLHLLGMLSVWDQNKSNTVGSPHPFLQITFFRNLELRKREWCLHRYKCLICPWTTDRGRQARLNVRAWLMAVEGRTKVLSFFSFSFSESLNQYPTCQCTKGHRSRESNTNALEPFTFDTVQKQEYSCHWISCIRTTISNYLGWRAFGIEGVYVNLALLFVFSEF